ncbi:hypothetical protein SADUNF_Sadunf02G0155400 [Salix dunnii]|uniref:Uncharacterized protein n=1 Tax=Salix dunnii TaxID=1413687 RepID=A0A835TKE0_9ROSI|nr:hypothetical protein SADUNF_Sadunf02G0155400 [Salix dunnii]
MLKQKYTESTKLFCNNAIEAPDSHECSIFIGLEIQKLTSSLICGLELYKSAPINEASDGAELTMVEAKNASSIYLLFQSCRKQKKGGEKEATSQGRGSAWVEPKQIFLLGTPSMLRLFPVFTCLILLPPPTIPIYLPSPFIVLPYHARYCHQNLAIDASAFSFQKKKADNKVLGHVSPWMIWDHAVHGAFIRHQGKAS